MVDMPQQRNYRTSAGHVDYIDVKVLRKDPALMVTCDRLRRDKYLVSQAAFSRFENSATPKDLCQMVRNANIKDQNRFLLTVLSLRNSQYFILL